MIHHNKAIEEQAKTSAFLLEGFMKKIIEKTSEESAILIQPAWIQMRANGLSSLMCVIFNPLQSIKKDRPG